MRMLIGAVALVFVMGAVPADAGWWIFGKDDDKPASSGMKKKLPKALDYPTVRPKVEHWHKYGKQAGNHPEHWK
jgi:hypothetical protein